MVIAALDDPSRALIDTLRLRQAPGVAPLDAALAYLEERSALIVLDNCEHVLEAAADLALRIARGCPGVHVLATSREPLALPGESIIPIRGLPLDSAVALFTRRAAEVGAVVQNEELAAEICTGLDGLPLALELAAAALVDHSAQEVATSVSSGRLEVTSRRGEPRHRSLDAVIAWGVDLLTSADADGLRSLSVFAGPFESAAADSVGAEAPGRGARAGTATPRPITSGARGGRGRTRALSHARHGARVCSSFRRRQRLGRRGATTCRVSLRDAPRRCDRSSDRGLALLDAADASQPGRHPSVDRRGVRRRRRYRHTHGGRFVLAVVPERQSG